MLSRREFIRRTVAGAVAGAAILDHGWVERIADQLAAGVPGPGKAPVYVPGTDKTFPVITVSGSPHEIGVQIGKQFGPSIKTAMERRKDWFRKLKGYASGDGKATVEKMLATATIHTPGPLEELRGWAEGAALEFMDLFIYNIKSEIQAFIDSKTGCAGCTTIVVKTKDSLIVAHNEDGHIKYEDLMFLVEGHPKGGPEFLGLAYPGIMEGNAPWANSHGILMTTNYIPSAKVVPGIPRYFLDRAAMGAKTLDEAIEIVSHPDRGYAYHHIVASMPEKKAFSVEANPDKLVVKEIDGLFHHTNHLVWPDLKDEPQFEDYIGISSMPRYNSVKKDLGGKGPEKITAGDVLAALSSHESRPTRVCRHAKGTPTGVTLGTFLFTAPLAKNKKTNKVDMAVYRNQPCNGRRSEFGL